MASFTNACVKLNPQLANMEQFNAVSSAWCVTNPHFVMSGHASLPFSVSSQCAQTSMKTSDSQGQHLISAKPVDGFFPHGTQSHLLSSSDTDADALY